MKQELQSFLGATNYLQTFMPHLSHHTELLWVLLKKENTFAWDQNVNDSFQRIKGLLKNSLLKPLQYYNRNKPVILQYDALLKGLGACTLQDGKPIAFTSKSLMDTETRYMNIERELLAIVFRCKKFHTYLYGRSFVVESDHKPLEMICLKNLISAPVRLQRMLLRLQQYDMVITYWPGKEMYSLMLLVICPQEQTILKLSSTSESTQYLLQHFPVADWPRLQRRHRKTQSCWLYINSHWTDGHEYKDTYWE